MQRWQGFADNGACPVDPAGRKTCQKKGKVKPIMKTALPFLGKILEWKGSWFCVESYSSKPSSHINRHRQGPSIFAQIFAIFFCAF